MNEQKTYNDILQVSMLTGIDVLEGVEQTERTITMQVGGLSCASCVSKVQKALGETEGILSATVNFATEQATVEFLPESISRREIKEIVQKLGYEVQEILGGENLVEREKRGREVALRTLRFKFFTGLSLLIPLLLLAQW